MHSQTERSPRALRGLSRRLLYGCDVLHRETPTAELQLYLSSAAAGTLGPPQLGLAVSAAEGDIAVSTPVMRTCGRIRKQPDRFLPTMTMPHSRPAPQRMWKEIVKAAQAICIECFRVFTADQYGEAFLPLASTNELVSGALLPAIASRGLSADGDLEHAYCINGYCLPSRQHLLGSVSRGLGKAELSPVSEVAQVSGVLHTGMHMPVGGESELWTIEQARHPHLRVGVSGIPNSGRGVFAARPLRPGEIVCTVIGQLRVMNEAAAEDLSHPLSLDLGFLDEEDPSRSNLRYRLRLFRQSLAGIINSSVSSQHSANCAFFEHPHFAEHVQYYLERRVYPSGAYCVKVLKDCIAQGEELFINYKWTKHLHTESPK
jgi:hypothetical protein